MLVFEPIQPQVVLWQGLWTQRSDRAALEYLQLEPTSARGSIIGIDDDAGPFRLEYEVDWDRRWHTAAVEMRVARGGAMHRLHLKRAEGNWVNEKGEELTALRGCVDVDIWPTPFTNTLPIRRLDWVQNQRQVIEVLYINGLELSIEKAVQAYTYLGGRLFRFESVGTEFVAELQVDEHGLVSEYSGLFARLGRR